MTAVIALIDQIAIGIYFLILAGILLALRRFLLHGEEYRSSYFELERDLARYRRLERGHADSIANRTGGHNLWDPASGCAGTPR